MMTLFWSSRSPYVRKVMVAAHEIGVQDRFTIVQKNVATLKPDDEVTAANPLGKIPALVREDGTSLCDFSVICEFLDGLVQPRHCFPQIPPPGLSRFASRRPATVSWISW